MGGLIWRWPRVVPACCLRVHERMHSELFVTLCDVHRARARDLSPLFSLLSSYSSLALSLSLPLTLSLSHPLSLFSLFLSLCVCLSLSFSLRLSLFSLFPFLSLSLACSLSLSLALSLSLGERLSTWRLRKGTTRLLNSYSSPTQTRIVKIDGAALLSRMRCRDSTSGLLTFSRRRAPMSQTTSGLRRSVQLLARGMFLSCACCTRLVNRSTSVTMTTGVLCRERERDRQTDRERQTDRHTQTDRQTHARARTHTQRERESARVRMTNTQTCKHTSSEHTGVLCTWRRRKARCWRCLSC